MAEGERIEGAGVNGGARRGAGHGGGIGDFRLPNESRLIFPSYASTKIILTPSFTGTNKERY
jgi:hypothetical protein